MNFKKSMVTIYESLYIMTFETIICIALVFLCFIASQTISDYYLSESALVLFIHSDTDTSKTPVGTTINREYMLFMVHIIIVKQIHS